MLNLNAEEFRDILFGLEQGIKKLFEADTEASTEAAGRIFRLRDMMVDEEPIESNVVTIRK